MYASIKLLFVAIALIGYSAAEVEKEGGVWVLGKDNFDETINSNSYVLVEFYAPWCGHCKSMKADYAQAAEQLTNAKVYIITGGVLCGIISYSKLSLR